MSDRLRAVGIGLVLLGGASADSPALWVPLAMIGLGLALTVSAEFLCWQQEWRRVGRNTFQQNASNGHHSTQAREVGR